MAAIRRKSRGQHPASCRDVGEQAHLPDFGKWARGLLANATTELTDDELAVLDAQVKSLAKVEPSAAGLPPDPTAPTIVRDRRSLKQIAARLKAAPEVVIDIETSALDPFDGEIVGVGLSVTDVNYYFPTGHRFPENQSLRADQLPVDVVARQLRLDQLPLVAHNAKFEFRWLRRHAGVSCEFTWDVMLAARLLASHLSAGLKELAARELDTSDWSMGKEEIERLQFLPVERVARYCAKDCRHTLDLYRRQRACLA
jgi:DNA polymerase I-like protein with 3'-5' exonuclease and polymerase domains